MGNKYAPILDEVMKTHGFQNDPDGVEQIYHIGPGNRELQETVLNGFLDCYTKS